MYNQYNPYFSQQRAMPQQMDLQQPIQPYMMQTPLTMAKNNILQGKIVDTREPVAKILMLENLLIITQKEFI